MEKVTSKLKKTETKTNFSFIRLLKIFTVLSLIFALFVYCSSNSGGKTRKSLSASQSKEIARNKYEHLPKITPVKNQSRTGTCWAYSTISFIEAEAIKKGTADENIDLSEIFIIYYAYLEKSRAYLERLGKSKFSEGGLDYDAMLVMDKYGLVRSQDYKPKNEGYHRPLVKDLLNFLHKTVKNHSGKGKLTNTEINKALTKVRSILDKYFGKIPDTITYEGKKITPKDYAKKVLKINRDDYVEIPSYTHLPLYKYSHLKLPDNWQYFDKYINVKLDEFVGIVNNSLTMGHSVSVNSDVTEESADLGAGNFILPEYLRMTDYKMLAEERQEMFEYGTTTDDHAMHIVGLDKDKDDYDLGIIPDEGNMDWYYLKNSWGEYGGDNGFMHMSEYYFKLKVLGATVHKDSLKGYAHIIPDSK